MKFSLLPSCIFYLFILILLPSDVQLMQSNNLSVSEQFPKRPMHRRKASADVTAERGKELTQTVQNLSIPNLSQLPDISIQITEAGKRSPQRSRTVSNSEHGKIKEKSVHHPGRKNSSHSESYKVQMPTQSVNSCEISIADETVCTPIIKATAILIIIGITIIGSLLMALSEDTAVVVVYLIYFGFVAGVLAGGYNLAVSGYYRTLGIMASLLIIYVSKSQGSILYPICLVPIVGLIVCYLEMRFEDTLDIFGTSTIPRSDP